jgi:hypothetical protein
MEDLNERMRELERRSRAAFDSSVESMDGATRSKLARARAEALGGHRRGRSAAAGWVPVGAAAAALAAALLWPRGESGRPLPPEPAAFALEDFDIVAGGEDFDLLNEDADFVAWAAAESDGVG